MWEWWGKGKSGKTFAPHVTPRADKRPDAESMRWAPAGVRNGVCFVPCRFSWDE